MNERLETWHVIGGSEQRRSRASRGSNPPPPPPSANFPGDPGDGNYNIGWSIGSSSTGYKNNTITACRNNPGYPGDSKVSVIHDYAGNAVPNFTKIDNAISAGFIPSQSFKLSSTSQAAVVVSGGYDAQIDSWAASCMARAPWPIWLCYFHEPENDFTTASLQTSYRAATRRMVLRFRTAGVTNVAWQPIYMNPFTWETSARDWRNWHADWTGSTWNNTLTMDMFGADTYDPEPGSATNQSFAQMWNKLRSKVETTGYPVWDYTQPEFGMSNNASPTPDWRTWSTAARDYAKDARIKNFCYWDNSDDQDRYSFTSGGDPTGFKLTGWTSITNAATKKVTA